MLYMLIHPPKAKHLFFLLRYKDVILIPTLALYVNIGSFKVY